MKIETLKEIHQLAELFGFNVEFDNDGQIVLYTDLRCGRIVTVNSNGDETNALDPFDSDNIENERLLESKCEHGYPVNELCYSCAIGE